MSLQLTSYPWGSVTEIPNANPPEIDNDGSYSSVLLIFIPVLVVVLTVLLGLVIFLVAILYMRRRRGIRLLEDGGPLDLSKGDGIIGEGGVEGVEERWLETVDLEVREAYNRAKDWQLQYPPSSVPTDITLSQFLSIQEKGVSAWAFEPDYEDNLSLYVQSRTEITFLADGPGMPTREGGGNSVMANLPLPKLNEVYYWEVKMYDKPATTEVAIGLATKPYPSFRLPGWNKYSVAYFASDGFKSHNFPFTAASYGSGLAEGDVLGVGYRPRTGTVFFTRNGRKLDDAFTGLQRLNLFPTIGANGPCTLHVNFGQAGFVFIEANVKKWGLAPMTGTLAPPPAYGSERGSILLEAGYGTPGAVQGAPRNAGNVEALLQAARNRTASHVLRGQSPPSGPSSERRSHKTHRQHVSESYVSSPLRPTEIDGVRGSRSSSRVYGPTFDVFPSYVSPTDTPISGTRVPPVEIISSSASSVSAGERAESEREQSPLNSLEHNPPTPNLLDISMHSLRGGHFFPSNFTSSDAANPAPLTSESPSAHRRQTCNPSTALIPNSDSPPPPGYAPLDPHVYANGLPADLPEEMVNQAIAAMSDA
nr:endosome protein [Cryptococcus depauperatus CBS 7841]